MLPKGIVAVFLKAKSREELFKGLGLVNQISDGLGDRPFVLVYVS